MNTKNVVRVILLIAPAFVFATERMPTKLEKLIGEEAAAKIGAHKLTDKEQNEVAALLVGLARQGAPDSLEKAAVAYMKNSRYEVVNYHGEATKGFKTYHVFSWGVFDDTYAVEEGLLFLQPGRCFAKIGVLGQELDEVIDSNGRAHRFILSKWIKLK